MGIRIVADSSSDLLLWDGVDYVSVPLRIITDYKEYTDNKALDVALMVQELLNYKGKSGTSCPNVADWLDAFSGADEVLCFTITSNLSGAYASAMEAKKEYEQTNPEAKVYVVDSLSVGGETRLLMEKAVALLNEGKAFEEVCAEIEEYKKTTHLIFALESMKNLVNNGRVDRLSALAAGLLGIRAIGQASTVGTLEMLKKARGKKQALQTIFELVQDRGFRGGKLRIAHCENEAAAQELASMVKKRYPLADIEIRPCGGLCSFYAEHGGLILGFEGH
ncbi:MAG: DegV family protein [Clostridia bacterium]|nr:DegV family protein [Clostridia bacterium]